MQVNPHSDVGDFCCKCFEFFSFLNSLNLLTYFAISRSICKYVIQVVISTGMLKFVAQAFTSVLTEVHISYLYLLTKRLVFQ